MPRLIPVEGNPFDQSSIPATTPKLVPVEGNPFEAQPNQASPLSSAGDRIEGSALSHIAPWLSGKLAAEGQRLAASVPPGNNPPAVDQLKRAVTDIPGEIYGAGQAAASKISELNPLSRSGDIAAQADMPIGQRLLSLVGQYENVGRGLAGVPELAGAPLTGAARSLIGHPYSALTGMPYEESKGAVDLAMAGLRPSGIAAAGPRTVAAPVPTEAQLYNAAKAGYKAPEVASVEIHPQSVAALSQRIEQGLVGKGFRPVSVSAAPTFQEIRDLTPPSGAQSVKIDDLDSAAKALRKYAKERDFQNQPTPNAAAASQALRDIGDYLTVHLPSNPAEVLAGDVSRAAPILREAQGNWAALEKSQEVGRRLTLAELKGGTESAMRNKMAQILTRPGASVGYRPDELAIANEIARGTTTRNALQMAGRLGFDNPLAFAIHAGATIPSGGMNLPIGLAGTAAGMVGRGLTKSAINNLARTIRARSPLAQKTPQLQLPPPPRALGILPAAMLAQPNRLAPQSQASPLGMLPTTP